MIPCVLIAIILLFVKINLSLIEEKEKPTFSPGAKRLAIKLLAFSF